MRRLALLVMAIAACEPVGGIDPRRHCVPGASRCSADGTVREYCDESGPHFEVCVEPSPACRDGVCTTCAAGAVRCVDGAAQRCEAGGTKWSRDSEVCPFAFHERDEARPDDALWETVDYRPKAQCTEERTCPLTCTPRSTVCASRNRLVRCSTDGATQTIESCAFCVHGRCEGPHVRAISAGDNHTCALIADVSSKSGALEVHCWGDNFYCQVGDCDLGEKVARPVLVRRSAGTTQMALSEQRTCLAGQPVRFVAMPGTSEFPCLPGWTEASTPAIRYAVESISAGRSHVCWILERTLRCSSFAGSGTVTEIRRPLPATDRDYKRVISGGAHACAEVGWSDGTTSSWYCFGANEKKQVAAISESVVTTPVEVSDSVGATLVAGGEHTCGIFGVTREVRCWGHNAEGQVGPFSETIVSSPRAVPGMVGVRTLAAGASHTCAVTSDGGVTCWGLNDARQANPRLNGSPVAPVRVVGVERVASLALGLSHSCALSDTGAITCWGANDRGQLGNPLGGPGEPFRVAW